MTDEPAPTTTTDDDTLVERSSHAVHRATSFGIRTIATTAASGFLMGSADIVPGVSGGTVALVLGIYDRLVANIRQGAHALALGARGRGVVAAKALAEVDWTFLLPLLIGIGTAIVTLASGLEHLLENEPVLLSAVFFGLIAGSVAVSVTELDERSVRTLLVAVAAAVVTFVVLGLRSGRFEDPSLIVLFGGGALAICAMILPGISGSFILLMLGLYETVLGAVNDRDLAAIAAFGVGAVIGLGVFSTLLNWLLANHRDTVLAALIGLMAGSLRVLWPWPAGPDGVGDTTLGAPVAAEVLPAVGLALAGAVGVVVVARTARALSEADD
jgi:putative membrane protein